MSADMDALDTETIASHYMRIGDRIVVEPSGADDFIATVKMCLGWGIQHGVMNYRMYREDGSEFTYGIHIDAPVKVLRPAPVVPSDGSGQR